VEEGNGMGQVIDQDEEIKKLFYEKIKAKVENERQRLGMMIDKAHPFLGWAIKGFAFYYYDNKVMHDEEKGSNGEEELEDQLWMLLPSDSYILPDYVLEPRKGVFIQMDQIVINLKGIFLVEVKTWSGSFLASDKAWKRKEGNKWVSCSNPTKQHKRHFDLFNLWLRNNLPQLYLSIKDFIYPVIVLKQTGWIQSKYSSIPVVSGASGFVDFIIEKPRGKLTPEILETVTEKIRTAKPYEEKTNFTEDSTKYGKRFVRVKGTLEDAQSVCKAYKAKGYKTTEINVDKKDKDVFYFYIEQH